MLLLLSADFFSEIIFSKKFFHKHHQNVKIFDLDPDQDRHFFCPDMGPNCMQRLSADDKSCC